MPRMFKWGGPTDIGLGDQDGISDAGGPKGLAQQEALEKKQATVRELQREIIENEKRLQEIKPESLVDLALGGVYKQGVQLLADLTSTDLRGLTAAEQLRERRRMAGGTTKGQVIHAPSGDIAGTLSLADTYGYLDDEKGGEQGGFLSTLPPLPLNVAPLAAPSPVAPEGLPGSSPLASLDPLLFPPSQTNVLQPTIFAHGGAVMPELGFRPLHYQDGTGPEGVEDSSTQHERDLTFLKDIFSGDMENLPPGYRWDLNTLERAFYEWENDPDVARRAAEKLRKALEGPQEEFYPDVDPDSEFGKFLWPMGLTVAGPEGQPRGVRPGDTGPSADEDIEKFRRWAPMEESILKGLGMAPPAGARDWQKDARDWMHYDRLKKLNRERNPPSEWEKERGIAGTAWSYGGEEAYFPEGIAHGGYVGRRPGHYANGGYASRGTVAGELPRYGRMSVREEGETMGELSKRHRDQDWYRRMRGGLGSLGPRRRVA